MRNKFILKYLICVLMLAGSGIAFSQSNFLDTTFDIGTGAQGGFIESMALQPDGKILICGNFSSFNGQPKSYIARLNTDGSVDTNFTADVSYWIRAITLQADGKILVGGFFTFAGGQPRSLIARLNSDGTHDTSFNPGAGGTGILGAGIDGNADPFIFAIAVQPDQKIVIGGNFANFDNVGRRGIARLETNGVLDTTFAVGSGVNSWIRSLHAQTNGQIMASGWFTSYKDQSFNRMVRINPDGSPDTTFNAYFGDQTAVYTVAPLSDGKMIAGGHTINSTSVFQQEIVRLFSDGRYDTNFNTGGSGANDKVESVAVQDDGKIMLGGYFSSYNGAGVHNIARLNADGTLDTTFSASVDNWIWTVLLQPDGKVLVCGGFNSVNGVSRNGLARLNASAAPTLFNAKRFSDRFEISVLSQAGKNYTLQFKGSVSETNWTSLPAVAGDGGVKTLIDPNPSASNRYYRAIQN